MSRGIRAFVNVGKRWEGSCRKMSDHGVDDTAAWLYRRGVGWESGLEWSPLWIPPPVHGPGAPPVQRLVHYLFNHLVADH